MKARGLTTRMLAASSILAIVVVGVFAALLLAILNLRHTSDLARHSAEVIAAANKEEQLVLDLETGHRAFVITHQERFLEPWKAARIELPAQAATLERLVSDNREQEARARGLTTATLDYLHNFSEPLVAEARADRHVGRQIVATGEGKHRVDAIRGRFARFVAAEKRLSENRSDGASTAARRAIGLGIGGMLASALLVLLFAGYLVRAIVAPIRRVAAAAGRLARGDLSARVPASGSAELAELGGAFNTMAASLEESRDELESQNAELEVQAAELEEQQAQVSSANEELLAQRAELEHAVAEVEDQRSQMERLYDFGKLVAGETEREHLVPIAFGALADMAGAPVAAVYAAEPLDEEELTLAWSRGLDERRLPPRLEPNVGLAGRVVVERRTLEASYGEAGLRLTVFGEDVAVRQELHVPVAQGKRLLAVLSLGRIDDRGFSEAIREGLAHLTAQAATALSNTLALEQALNQAAINQVVIDASRDGIVLVDRSGYVVLANAYMRRLYEEAPLPEDQTIYERAELSAQRFADREGFLEFMARLAADPDLQDRRELEVADGGGFLELYSAPVRDASAELIGRILVVRDVTAAREAERAKSELVATVSHELRTPLASVLGFAELLAERELDEESQKRYVGTIHSEARRLTTLINDFLDLQRIEEGRFTIALEPFDLADVLRHEVELFSAQSSNHSLVLELPEGALPALGERDRIEQVVANLLSNAIKYSPEGGDVRVLASVRDGYTRVSVVDSGLGIPEEQHRKIFTKFFRVDSSDTREIGGTGLGLALCQEIVRAHGGTIGFDSAPGLGSTFWFELPSAREGRLAPATGRRVLVIEDDAEAAAFIVHQLTGAGYTVETASTGEEGLARAFEAPPDLVALDIGLAGELDGWQVLAQLKASSITEHIPVVVCTGGTGRDRASALGASDFLVKPFSPARLRQTVARLLPAAEGSVLVVDDDEAVRRLVVETLRSERLELREAADGEQALQAIDERRPDVVVLDLMMPRVDGFAVLERLQESEETRAIGVIVLTARRLSSSERATLRERATSLLEKSDYSAEELRRLIRRTLGGMRNAA